MRPSRLLAALLTALALPATTAAATPSWSQPLTVARPTCADGRIVLTRAAQDTHGDRLVAWVEQCGVEHWRVVACSQRAGRPFGAPRILGRPRSEGWSFELQVALDARDGAIVAWAQRRNGVAYQGSVVRAALRRPTHGFAHSHQLDANGGSIALAANPAGAAVLTWEHVSAPVAVPSVVAAAHRAGATSFSPVRTLSGPLRNATVGHPGGAVVPEPGVAVGGDGTAIVAWKQANGSAADCCEAIVAARRTPGGTFAPAQPVSLPAPFASLSWPPAVAVRDRDAAAISWTDDAGAVAARWDGRAFTAPVALGRMRGELLAPGVQLDADGTSWVQWRTFGDLCTAGEARYETASLSVDGAASSATLFLPDDRLYAGAAVARDAAGRRIAAWFDGRRLAFKYGCVARPTRLAGAVDGGSPVEGPTVGQFSSDLTLLGDGPTTALWVDSRGPQRIRLSQLTGY